MTIKPTAIPKGTFRRYEDGGREDYTDRVIDGIIAKHRREKHLNRAGLAVTADHALKDTERPTEALGWTDPDSWYRDDTGLVTPIVLTDVGAEVIGGGRFKGVDIEPELDENGQPIGIVSIAFSNIVSRGSFFNNREDSEVDYRLELTSALNLDSGASEAALKQACNLKPDADPDYRSLLLKLLRLPPGSTDTQIKQALDKRQHRGKACDRPSLEQSLKARQLQNRRTRSFGPLQSPLQSPGMANALVTMANRLAKGRSFEQRRQIAYRFPAGSYLRNAILKHQ